MAQFNFAEKSEIEELHIEPTDVMTGDKNKSRYLLYQLKLSMARAKQIDIIVSFLMESGVRMLLSDLKAALQRGVRIRILTGNYLGITQPSALYLLKKELGDKVELHFYSDKGRSFHPKSYIFHYDNMNEIYIGSSNISRSALTSGIEWNYRFNNNQDSQNFNLFYELTHKQVFFSSFTILKEQTLAEDIMQDTYVTFLNNIGDVKSSQNIYAYLSTIARNLSINYYKKMKRNTEDDEPLNYMDTRDMPYIGSNVITILELLDSQEEREIVTYHVILDYKFADIAKIMSKPLGTILWMYNRAIKKLKERMSKYEK